MDSIDKYYLSLDKENIGINRFLICFLIYTISITFLVFLVPMIVIKIALLLPSFIIFFWYFMKTISFKNIESLYLKFAFTALLLWIIYILQNGILFDYESVTAAFVFPYYALHYIIPLILLLPLTSSFFINSIIYYSEKLAWIFIIILPFFLLLGYYKKQGISEMLVWNFAAGCGFLLLTFSYQKKKTVVLSIIVLLISLLIVTYLARRNIMLTCLGYLVTALYIYLFYNKKINITKKIATLFIVTSIVLVGGYIYMSSQSSLFKVIQGRATVDSRTEVLILYFEEMDSNPNNWIIGKGINGSYYAPNIDNTGKDFEVSDYRQIIETGYLQLILKGGIVFVVLFLLVLLPAFVKGMFFSRNLFVKGCAAIVILWLVDMFAFGLPIFMFRYFLVWFCAGICFSKKLRLMTDEELKKYLNISSNEQITKS